MPSVPFRLAALLLVATTAFATPYPTNMDLLVETVSSAVDAGLADMDMPAEAAASALLVVPQNKHCLLYTSPSPRD